MYDPNVGQTDDADAVKVVTEILEGWQDPQLIRFDVGALVTDILVELPRRGWRLQPIGKTVRLEDCDILVGIEWQRATGEGFIPGQVYRVREPGTKTAEELERSDETGEIAGEVGTITGPPIVGTSDTTNAGPAVVAEGEEPPPQWVYDSEGRIAEAEVQRRADASREDEDKA